MFNSKLFTLAATGVCNRNKFSRVLTALQSGKMDSYVAKTIIKHIRTYQPLNTKYFIKIRHHTSQALTAICLDRWYVKHSQRDCTWTLLWWYFWWYISCNEEQWGRSVDFHLWTSWHDTPEYISDPAKFSRSDSNKCGERRRQTESTPAEGQCTPQQSET